jgi:hypothetical protein
MNETILTMKKIELENEKLKLIKAGLLADRIYYLDQLLNRITNPIKPVKNADDLYNLS